MTKAAFFCYNSLEKSKKEIKQKKNSNYATEKRRAAEEQKAEQKRIEKRNKTIKLAAIWSGGALGVVAVIFAILFAVGVFDYVPEVTYHASFSFDDGSSVHIELYGHDAPETVKSFIELCDSGYFKGMTVRELMDGMLTVGSMNADGGDKGIKGEFSKNGVDNKVPMKRGFVVLNRGLDFDSGYGQFCILTQNQPDFVGKYAAFGRVTDMSVIDKLISKLEVGTNGAISEASAPRINGVSTHEAH